MTPLVAHANQVDTLRERGVSAVRRLLSEQQSALDATKARLTTLGPAATLARGYAVVQLVDGDGTGTVLRSVQDAPAGTVLRIRVADGVVHAVVRNEPQSGDAE